MKTEPVGYIYVDTAQPSETDTLAILAKQSYGSTKAFLLNRSKWRHFSSQIPRYYAEKQNKQVEFSIGFICMCLSV